MLDIRGLKASYGHIEVLKGIDLRVDEGEIVTMIGSNGAGKSSLLKTISGVVRAGSGEITFKGRNIERWSCAKIVATGISHVPEGRQLFGPLTVFENLQLGAYTRYRRDSKKEIDEDTEFVFEMFPVLKERWKQTAGTLSGGEQQMLAIGRALMSKPQLLLLDEPSMGLAPIIIQNIFAILKDLRKKGLTLLLVEQDAMVALSIADRGYVLQNGQVVMADTSQNLLDNEDVKAIYFGHRDKAH
ncbi:MAG: ABC transporter ATP-binding protein [Candidatus Aquicultor primus]|uniref:ABC transporter ATP-binding protein n=1 Tax=Candidatus Aquicultor primus TaxID=1797195 RepID=A0A1F2UPR9_9ACTN|nr:MAG: ABC transporter ATP-binding protein [Candidatus Aquicultor primus]